ncbi:TetR/AcrR family transcriptional regulator [Actinocatenispora rupis]|uniref:TetR family transcriptional regulator n=1 Tax=Actinocatenispora rupis TaxID=519421 RepID=A0A8J3J2R6_9ACTN|nr:TetR/AcrR family transcriptional regulator [Actinocatenispora rupis]GID14726.1 TetR family transcriptional regulator [Actinocatenispora rupis]
MTAQRRTRLDPDARRSQLVEIGVRALSRDSLYDLSLDEIAAEAGISRSLLFHYFGSKRRFQLAVVEAAAAGLLTHTEPDRSRPPSVQLRQSIEDSVAYVSARRGLYLSLVRGAASGDEAMREIFDRTRGALVDRIMDGIADLGGTPGDPLLPIAVRSWLALTEEAIISWSPDGPVDRDRLITFVETAFYRAVLDPP